MPTANSLNKPRAVMPMGMGPVDPKKFRVENVAQKPATTSKPPQFQKTSTSSPKPRLAAAGTPSRTTNGSKLASGKASHVTSGHIKHPDVSRSARPATSKRGSPAVRTPTTPMFDEDDDDSESDDLKMTNKRRKLNNDSNLDTSRVIYNAETYDEKAGHELEMVHAADIAHEGPTSTDKSNSSFTNYFTTEIEEGLPLEHKAVLQYPSLCPPERYNLVAPKEKDDFKPLDEIIRVMTTVSKYYLPEPHSSFISDETNGLILQLRRSLKRDKLSDFHDLITEYNKFLRDHVQSSTVKTHLSSTTSPLPLPWVEQILTQTYSRTVSLHVSTLRRYENGTDNVYGELLPRFISNIFRETKLTSSQVFVDLGSGVGNVVLQAALEIGCESWGCEMMPNASQLATLQSREFASRTKLWGLAPGPVHLEHGDFLSNVPTLSVLKRADVVLVNNQAFTPPLNDKLIMHFLDLKEGCQIVSLKSFVPQGHKIQARNLESPINLLRDRELRYFSDSVSWTDAPGTYHVARKDRRGLEEFMRREMMLS